MQIATQYAKALLQIEKPTPAHLANLKAALERKGYGKLLPRIYTEYQALRAKQARAQKLRRLSPAQERTRTLLELYRKLIDSNSSL